MAYRFRNTARIAFAAALLLSISLSTTHAQAKPDALALFRQGRDLESRGMMAEARAKYQAAVEVCDAELKGDPSRMDAYVVKSWSQFRLQLYKETVETCEAALKLRFDARIVETMGEAYYFLGNMDLTLVSMRRYVEAVGESGDRLATAYFYMGEAYMRQKRFNHAYISYVAAVHYEKNMARWWYRLGQAAEAIGEPTRALEAYRRAVALAPAYQEAADAITRIQGSSATDAGSEGTGTSP